MKIKETLNSTYVEMRLRKNSKLHSLGLLEHTIGDLEFIFWTIVYNQIEQSMRREKLSVFVRVLVMVG